MFSSLDALHSQNTQAFTMESFSWKSSFDIFFFFIRNDVAFESSTEFQFSTSYDLKIAKLW